MGQYTSYYLYQKYEERGEQEPIPCYPNVYSIDGEGTMPLVVKSSADTECGAEGTIEDWFAVSTYCVGVSKYEKQEKAISYDDGDTWVYTGEYRDELVEPYSVECGYVPPPPQYRTISGDTYCSGDTGFDLYVDIYSQVSYDGGISWHTISSASTLVETDSVDCGVKYRWQPSGTTCVGYDKWEQSIRQKSYDDGETWIDVAPLETSATTLIEEDSVDCGYSPTQERWIKTSDTLCVEYFKFHAFYSDGTSYKLGCTSSGDTLTSADTIGHSTSLSAMTSAIIGTCVTEIGYCALGSYDSRVRPWPASLTSVTISNSVTSIGERAFQSCSALTSINIPSDVTTIGDVAFSECSSLSSITIPTGVTIIGENTFSYCNGLTSVTISDNVTTIRHYAFFNCTGLTSVVIGNGVTDIEDGAFTDCFRLQSVIIHAATPPTITKILDYPFDNTNNCPIYVPSGSVNAYKTASGWSTYASRIQAIP